MWGLLWFCINFWNICSTSVKYVIGILIRIALYLSIALGSMDILMMLVLPIYEHSIWFHLFVSSLITFFSLLQCSKHRSFTSLVRFIARYFILFEAIVKGIVLLISLSFSSLISIKMQLISGYKFCILLLCLIHLSLLVVSW